MASRVRSAFGALGACAVLALSGCIQPGRTVHPDSDPVPGAECPVPPDPSIDTDVTIAWQSIANGDLVVKDLGLLEKCMPNATIEWSRFNGGNDVIQAFGSGSIDMGILGSSAGVKAMSPPLELPVSLVGVPDVIGASEALVAFDPEITDISDLKGQTVAVTFGATPHYVLLSMLEDAGLEGQVEVINLTNDTMLAAAKSDQIDAAWTWQPTLTELTDGGGHVVVDSGVAAEKGFVTFDMQLARNEFLEAEPEFVKMWTRTQVYASELMNEDPQLASESIATQLNMEPKVVENQIKGYTYLNGSELAGKEWSGGGAAASIESTGKFLADVGMTSAALSRDQYAEHVYPTAMTEVSGD